MLVNISAIRTHHPLCLPHFLILHNQHKCKGKNSPKMQMSLTSCGPCPSCRWRWDSGPAGAEQQPVSYWRSSGPRPAFSSFPPRWLSHLHGGASAAQSDFAAKKEKRKENTRRDTEQGYDYIKENKLPFHFIFIMWSLSQTKSELDLKCHTLRLFDFLEFWFHPIEEKRIIKHK